jgi:hypothetical protein
MRSGARRSWETESRNDSSPVHRVKLGDPAGQRVIEGPDLLDPPPFGHATDD